MRVLWYLCRKDGGSVVFMQEKMGVLWYLCRKR